VGLHYVSRLGAITAVAAAVVFAAPASQAATILTFSQTGVSSTVTGTANGGGTATTISIVNAAVSISSIAAGITTPINGFMTLSASSVGTASAVGGFTAQSFNGTFSITSASGGSGTNYLSGTFDDDVFGAGSSLTLSASTPGQTVTFTSDVIAPAALLDPNAMSLGFTDVSPQISITGQTLASFTSNVSGNFSAAAPIVASEPASIVILGMGLIGLGWMRRQRG
jgi:PEP-CTERM motif